MSEFSDTEARQAAASLIHWFNAAALTPGQARVVMAKVIAKSILNGTTDLAELQRQITLFAAEVSVEVSRQAKGVTRRG